MTSRSDVLLHPVRLRIVLAAAGRTVTTADLAGSLDDVPQATLYRHVGILVDEGVLDVVGERPVRGTTERSYALAAGTSHLTADDISGMTAADHRRAFTLFVGTLMEAFHRYISAPSASPGRDGVGYRQIPLWLDDGELEHLVQDLRAVVERYADHTERGDRIRRTLTTILIPDPPRAEAAGPDDR